MAAVTKVPSSAGNRGTTAADAPVAVALAPAAKSRHIAHQSLVRCEKYA